MTDVLKVSGLSAGYGRAEVVKGVSFTVGQGELCALLGANGSGKSTLLRAAVGLLPYTGSCLLQGRELSGLSRRSRTRAIGYLAQRGEQPLSISALDVVLMGFNPELGTLQSPDAAQRRHALEVMVEAEVADCAKKDYRALSEGQRQLVLIARTLVRDTGLIALDEPDSALDYMNRHKVMALLKGRTREGRRAVLMSSHDVNFALRYADRLLLLQGGELAYDINLALTSEQSLGEAFRDIYGPVELLRHNGRYLIME